MSDQPTSQATRTRHAAPALPGLLDRIDADELAKALAGHCAACSAAYGEPCKPGCAAMASLDIDEAWAGPVTPAAARLLLNTATIPCPVCAAAAGEPCLPWCR